MQRTILLALLFTTTLSDAFVMPYGRCLSGIKMTSSSESYLDSLRPPLSKILLDKTDLLKDVQTCNKIECEVDTIMFNIYKVENIFFNRNSRTVLFRLKQDMNDLFLYEDDKKMQRLSNGTKIYAKAFKNFMFLPMKHDVPVDAIMYKEQSNQST
jgi:hypothetical protein